jgi:hypothetical protein
MAGVGPFTVSGMNASDPTDQVPAGTVWKLVLLDPLGRASSPAEIISVTPL